MSIRTCLKLMMTITCVVPICAQQDDSTRGNENRAILQLIEGASPNENLAVLQAALDSIAYRLEDPEGYARIVSGAFNSLYAKGTHDVLAARRVEQRYALFALDRPDLLPADMELYVAMRLRANISSIGEYDEEELRRKLDILFHAWRRMEREIIANFDFSPANFPEENVWPPADAIGHTSGKVRGLTAGHRREEGDLAGVGDRRVRLDMGVVDRRADHLRLFKGVGVSLAALRQPADQILDGAHIRRRFDRFFRFADPFAHPGEIFDLHPSSSSMR